MNDVNQLRSRVNLLTKIVSIQSIVLGAILFIAAKKNDSTVDTIRAHHVIIVDDHDVQRVHLGAPVPEPIVQGRTMKRDEPAAGVMIYDAAGNERGGYITDNNPKGGNALLTLDNATEQAVTLVAYPERGAEAGLRMDREHYVACSATAEFTGLRSKQGTVEVAHLNLLEANGSAKEILKH